MACSSTQKIRFQLRRALESDWITSNPILLAGEPAVSTDTKQIKIGTGDRWVDTDYINLAGGVGAFGTPTTLTDLVTLTADLKSGINVSLPSQVTLSLNQAVRFTNDVTASGGGGNIVAGNVYFAVANYSATSTIQIKRGTAVGLLPY
jgi:hypothetical protein